MERLTKHHFKKQDGFYMTCSEHCSKEDFSCEDCGEFDKLVDRLGTIEDILGDEYDLDRLREMVEESKQIDKMLKVGDDVWYVDFDKGDIEKGKVETVNYKNGKLDCFGVDFEDDFDVFDGSGWGKYFFGSELNARKALLKGDKS